MHYSLILIADLGGWDPSAEDNLNPDLDGATSTIESISIDF